MARAFDRMDVEDPEVPQRVGVLKYRLDPAIDRLFAWVSGT
ncbi:hypothetical protein [Paenibacillus sp. SI8]